jgi:anti-anti-sigma factor
MVLGRYRTYSDRSAHPVTEGIAMPGSGVKTETRSDGTVIVHPHGDLDPDGAERLRRLLVHAIRHVRPHRLILDLGDLGDLDPIDIGTLAAACTLGDDHRVDVYLDNSPSDLAARLAAAGVPRARLRTTRPAPCSSAASARTSSWSRTCPTSP